MIFLHEYCLAFFYGGILAGLCAVLPVVLLGSCGVWLCGYLLVRAGDGWENPLPGCPGCPGFCSLCLSYRNRLSEPLALFLKKKPAARPRPGHGGHGCAGIPSAANLFGCCTGPLRRPKKRTIPCCHTPRDTVRPLKPIARRAGLLQRLCPGRRMLPCRSPAPRAIWFRCRPTTRFPHSRRHRPPPTCPVMFRP